MSQTDDDLPKPASPKPARPRAERRAELERIRDALWPPNESAEDRAARVARNLAALEEVRRLPKYKLTIDDWKLIERTSVFGDDDEDVL
jgi:hypothetical protein